MVWLKHCLLIILSSLLFACGGDGSVDLSGGDDGGDDGGEDPVAVLSVTLYDCKNVADANIPSDCSSTSSISLDAPATAIIRLLDPAGASATNEIITLVSDNADVSSSQVLTDSSGYAQATLFAQVDSESAGSLTATSASYDVSGSANFSVGASDLNMALSSSLPDGQDLAVDATATFTVTVTDSSGALYTTPVTVDFTSSCVNAELASITESVTTVNGVGTAIYEPNGCSGSDTITATPALSVLSTQQIEISIAETIASSIAFVDALPTTIYLDESVGTKISVLTFKVLDKTGNPKSSQTVDFAADASLFGLTLSPTSGESNANGEVVTRVTSGTMPGSVVVTASFTDEAGSVVSAVSNSLNIHTGTPSQSSMSLAASVLAMEAWNIDGVVSDITLRVSDENKNPVPDNTSVTFTAEGGQITGSCKTTGQDTNSGCTVTWVSQNDRPKGHTYDLPAGICIAPGIIPTDVANTQGTFNYGVGRATLLAYTLGQEVFADVNGNRVFDSGEIYTELGEAYIDANEDGSYNSSGIFNHDAVNVNEAYNDYNENGGFDTTTGVWNSNDPVDAVNAEYNGLLCTKANETAGNCTRDLVEIRDSVVVIMGTSGANVLLTHFAGSGTGYQLNSVVTETVVPVIGSGLINDGDTVTIAGRSYEVVSGTSATGNITLKGAMYSFIASGSAVTHSSASYVTDGLQLQGNTQLYVDSGVGSIITGDIITIDGESYLVRYGTSTNGTIEISGGFKQGTPGGSPLTIQANRAVSSVDLTVLPYHQLAVTVQDLNGNQMPAGTTVSVSTANGEVSGVTSYTVADGTRLCDVQYITVEPESSPNNKTVGSLDVKVSSPGGVESGASLTVLDAS
ncbi:hypothetical protein ACVFI8_07555 [Agarivorans sp. MS3-6]